MPSPLLSTDHSVSKSLWPHLSFNSERWASWSTSVCPLSWVYTRHTHTGLGPIKEISFRGQKRKMISVHLRAIQQISVLCSPWWDADIILKLVQGKSVFRNTSNLPIPSLHLLLPGSWVCCKDGFNRTGNLVRRAWKTMWSAWRETCSATALYI